MELKGIVESLIFASNRPLTLQQLRNLTNTPLRQLKAVVEELQAEHQDSGIQVVEVGGGYQFRTHPEAVNWVRRLLAGRPQRMTRPMLETLAIIAYQQPITRPEIEEIRGVDCGNTLRLLLERNLLRILGKKEEVGRPLLYGTTKYFLEFFQLPSLKDLPTLKEFTELSPEHEDQVQFFFGNKGEAPSQPLEGPPEPPHLRAVSEDAAPTEGAVSSEELDAKPNEIQPEASTQQEQADAADIESAPAAAPAEQAPVEPAAAEQPAEHVKAAAEPQHTAPAPASLDNDEEDDAVLDSLDRAIARAGSVLREINPRPKRKKADQKPTDGDADNKAAEADAAVVSAAQDEGSASEPPQEAAEAKESGEEETSQQEPPSAATVQR